MKHNQTFRTNSGDVIGSLFLWIANLCYVIFVESRSVPLDQAMVLSLFLVSVFCMSNTYRKLQIDGDTIKFRSLFKHTNIPTRTVASCEFGWAPGGKGTLWSWLKFTDANGIVLFRFLFLGDLPELKKTLKRHQIDVIGF